MVFSAAIFADGHDELVASLLLKHAADRQWKEYPLTHRGNDRWTTSLALDRQGRYQYRVQAWVHPFGSWSRDFRKKTEASQYSDTDRDMGVQLLESAAVFAAKADRALLLQWSAELATLSNAASVLELVEREGMSNVTRRCCDPRTVTRYPLTLEIESERKKAAFSTWYELFPRSASQEPGKHGSFKDVLRLLPRLEEMGFDVLYLPPVHPIGRVKRKGRNNALTAEPGDPGSPWAIGSNEGGHKALHPELGTLRDFRKLIETAKKHGIDIAMDLAFQCAPDHPYVQQHPEWFKWRPDGTVQYAENPPKKYEDILPFHFETEDWRALWEELKSVVLYWVGQGIEIFRVDNPHTKPFPFWEWLIASIRKEHPQVLFLAEAFTRPRLMERLGMIGFSQSYTYFTWRTTRQELETYMKELTRSPMRYYFRPNFWPNTPDILPPLLSQGGEPAFLQRLVLAATLSSNYGLYGPVYEFGLHTPYPGKEEYIDNEKYELKQWDWEADTRIREVITRLNRVRREHPALQSTWNISFAESNNDQLICYGKADAGSGDVVLVAVNLDPFHPQSAHVKVPLEPLGLNAGVPYTLYDVLSGNRYRWEGEWNYIALNPHEMPAHVFIVTQ